MNKIFFCFLLFSCISSTSFSQLVHHEALTALGSSYSNTLGKLTISLGQLANKNYFSAGIHINEGLLQQASGLPLANEEVAVSGVKTGISIFPIPAKEELRVLNSAQPNLLYKIYNINAQLVGQGNVSTQIDIRTLMNGVYYLKFFTLYGDCFYSSKFIKS